MIINLLARIIQLLSTLLSMAVIVDVFVSYFLSPFHPIRKYLDIIVVPLLNPIRKFLPPIQRFDFSPLVLIILIQIVEMLLIQILGFFITG